VVRNGKSTAGHQRYLCSHCRKTWQLQFTYTASQPGTQQKIIDMAMNVGTVSPSRYEVVYEFGHLNRGDMLTSEQHRCHNEKEISAQSLNANPLNWSLTRTTPWQMQPALWMSAFPQ
jgi:hypothetical protein